MGRDLSDGSDAVVGRRGESRRGADVTCHCNKVMHCISPIIHLTLSRGTLNLTTSMLKHGMYTDDPSLHFTSRPPHPALGRLGEVCSISYVYASQNRPACLSPHIPPYPLFVSP